MNATEKRYPDPVVNLETAAYWEATRQGKLLLKRCTDCGRTHYYPRAICPHCLGGNTEWTTSVGRGRIYSYSVLRRALVPYAIAYVTLEEGVAMLTNLVECDFDQLAIGDPVELVFRATEAGMSVPVFRPGGRAERPAGAPTPLAMASKEKTE